MNRVHLALVAIVGLSFSLFAKIVGDFATAPSSKAELVAACQAACNGHLGSLEMETSGKLTCTCPPTPPPQPQLCTITKRCD